MISGFSLAFREQQQLFMYDWDYAKDIISQPGGLSAYVGRFFAQFFYNPGQAVAITAILLVLLSALVWLFLRRSSKDFSAICLAVCPALLLAASLADNALHIDVLAAMLFFAAATDFHVLFLSKFNPLARYISGCIIAAILFLIAGPASFLYALCATVHDFGKFGKGGLPSLLYTATAIAAGLAAFRCAFFGAASSVFSPFFFYEPDKAMPAFHFVFWFAAPVLMLLQAISVRAGSMLRTAVCAAIAIAALAVSHFKNLLTPVQNDLYRCEYYTVNGQWDKLANVARKRMNQYAFANYYNLAKAEDGTLVTDLFKVPQGGPKSLIFIQEGSSEDYSFAHVLFAMGDLAAAQSVAFNLCRSNCGFNPAMLEILAQVDIQRGTPEIAGRYLALLSKAPHYRKWVEGLDRTRNPKALPDTGTFVLDGSPMLDIFDILDTDPSNVKALQYGLSYLLLSRDIANTYRFIDKYYGRGAFTSLPVPAQEALMFFYDYFHTTSREYALSHGVPEADYDEFSTIPAGYLAAHGVEQQTMSRFDSFKRAYGAARGGMPQGYGDTFWNYMLFVKI